MAEAAPVIDQVEYWNGDVGRKWAENQERMDRAFAGLTAHLLERAAVQAGERVVDIGCGAGVVSLAAARQAGAAGRVLGVDISRPLLERARARAREGAAIEWREADAATFAFASGGFDLLVSRFGVMFFADPVAAFGNLRRALRAGGRLAMLCWRTLPENAWVAVPRAALLQVLPPPPPLPPETPGPFAFADAARVGAILTAAGFTEVRSARVDGALEIGSDPDEQARFLTELGPASALLREAEEPIRKRGVEAVRAALRERSASGEQATSAACWLYTAANA